MGLGIFHIKTAKKAIWLALEEKGNRAREYEKTRGDREILSLELNRILKKYDCETATDLRKGFVQLKQAELESESYRKTYSSLLDGADPSQLKSLVDNATKILNQNGDLLKRDLDAEISKLRQEELDSVARIKEIEGKLSYVFSGGRSPADAETEIQQIDLEIAKQEKNLRAVELAILTFGEVYYKRKSDFTPLINEKVNSYMDILTGGKYQDVRVSEEYKMRVAPDKKALYPAEYLSNGNYEQIYFALRLALGSLIGNKGEPLFLDDFLIAYDDVRALRAMKLLKSMSNERQILLFTCHSRDVENASGLDITISHLKEEIKDVC